MPQSIGHTIDWSTLRSSIQTGDIILCQTRNTLGFLQELATDAPYTHVAVFVRFNNDRLLIFESAMDKEYKDIFTDKTDGPKLVDADLYVHKYLSTHSGVITYRSLRYALGRPVLITPDQRNNLYSFIAHTSDPKVRYERQLLDLPNAFLRVVVHTHSDPSSMFCSELVAGFLLTMGVSISRPADQIVPRDFGTGYEDCFNVRYNTGPRKVSLGIEVTVRDA